MPQTEKIPAAAQPPSRIRSTSAVSPRATGHHRLADGSLVRIDIELGRWVGRLYTPDLVVKSRVVGSDAEVHAWADRIAA